jgi:hypothetical protein
MLQFSTGQAFTTGAITYTYRPVTERETSPRIFLQVSIEGIDTAAFLDTGAPFVVCKPEIAEVLGLDPASGEPLGNFRLRDSHLNGHLHRMNVTLLAEQGDPLSVEATVFVPDPKSNQEWGNFPTILGMGGFLERIRFAVDPSQDQFYFGALP